MTAYEIPLSPNPQTFAISLAGADYQLTVVWNTAAACWVVDIADANNNPILFGVPIITGLDLLTQYRYLGFDGSLVVQTDGSQSLIAEFDGNTSVPIVGPGDWFVIGSSAIGDGSMIWGPSLSPSGSSSGSLLQANIEPNDVPTAVNLGTTSHLYFVVSS